MNILNYGIVYMYWTCIWVPQRTLDRKHVTLIRLRQPNTRRSYSVNTVSQVIKLTLFSLENIHRMNQ